MIQQAMMIRVIVTFILISIVSIHYNGNKLGLFIIIMLMDKIDGIFRPNYTTREYQHTDKIVDLWTYGLVAIMVPVDNMYRLALSYRAVGVALFVLTSNNWWLIVCPDICRELLLYRYIVEPSNSGIPTILLLKTAFEYYHHGSKIYTPPIDT